MGNPIKQYCIVHVTDGVGLSVGSYNVTVSDAETGDVLEYMYHLHVKRDDERLQELAEIQTDKTCLEVIRE